MTPQPRPAPARVPARAIRPPDLAIVGKTLAYMEIGSAEATRRLLHLAFRDAHTAIDLTYGAGRFWQAPLPPGLVVTSNNLNVEAPTDLHLDFTATGLPDGAYDLAVYDPPHLADAGESSFMRARYGTVKGTAALRAAIQAGAREAWRISRVGILVKVANSNHGSELHLLDDWIKDAVPMRPYAVLHTTRRYPTEDGKRQAVRVPKANGSIYLCFRHDGHRHRDFDALYARSVVHPLPEVGRRRGERRRRTA